ncbi:hypothetical protein BH23ACT12_BH23ACT12_03210 [soil metagenome]
MTDALIGHSGFVGSALLRQRNFDSLYRSSNIHSIRGRSFDQVMCAGAPAQKWIANRDPKADRQNIERLIACLGTISCDMFVLASTVDVFSSPIGVDEDSPADDSQLHAYGTHRRLLERFVQDNFPNHLIVRLAGLVGPGLRKNVIFDFLNDNNLQSIDSRGVFQFYPMVNLWFDIRSALGDGLKLLHLTAEPLSVADMALHGFGRSFKQHLDKPPAVYDMRTKHAGVFGGRGNYQYNKRETLQAVRAYAQSEPVTRPPDAPSPS